MQSVLLVTGSARPNSVNKHMVKQVQGLLAKRERAEVSVADLVELDLPFFDGDRPPSAPGFEITNERALIWSKAVQSADKVLFIMPEYNHNLTAIQKNALDWLFADWKDKPVSGVAYGWNNGKFVAAAFATVLANVRAKAVEPVAQLQFGEIIDPQGAVLDQVLFDERVGKTIDALLASS